LPLIINEDAISPNAPHIRELERYNLHYILGVKPKDHKSLFDFVESGAHEVKPGEFSFKDEKDPAITHRFKILNNVPLNKSNQEVLVNFIEYWEYSEKKDKITYHNTWVTDFKVTCPAVRKKLSEFKSRYCEFDNIKIRLEKAKLSWNTIDEALAKQTAMEGNYLLKTNRKSLDADKIWKMYVTLTRIESAFRDLKSYPGLRPNFHQKERRVEGHIFITILGYHLLHSIEHTLRQAGERSGWVTIKRILSTHNYGTIQLPTTEGPVINLRKAGIPEGIHAEVYKKLRVDHSKLPVRQVLA